MGCISKCLSKCFYRRQGAGNVEEPNNLRRSLFSHNNSVSSHYINGSLIKDGLLAETTKGPIDKLKEIGFKVLNKKDGVVTLQDRKMKQLKIIEQGELSLLVINQKKDMQSKFLILLDNTATEKEEAESQLFHIAQWIDADFLLIEPERNPVVLKRKQI